MSTHGHAASKRLLALCGSPRRDGNSVRLAQAALAGARDAGHLTELVHVDDYVSSFLRDCRKCRDTTGACTIKDSFTTLFDSLFLPADGLILATPLYWYGMSGQLKTFFDRCFCHIAASCAESGSNVAGMSGKRVGLVISSEENYPGAVMGVVHQVQEYCRYTHSAFIGHVQGTGNRRGDVEADPTDPMTQARALGARLFSSHYSDYRIDTPRGASVWATQDVPRPSATPASV